MSNERSRSYHILVLSAHILFWIAIYFVPFIVNPREQREHPHGIFDVQLLVNHILLIFLFYFNSYYLLKGFYRRFGGVLYSLALVVCVISIISVATAIRLHHPPGPPPAFRPEGEPPLLPGPFMLMVVLVGAISIIYRLIIDRLEDERLRKDKETEALQAELSFLRSQISPHFIFNALNSTLSLILKKSDKAADSVLKISNLMRYMLYDSDAEKVFLSHEVDYIHDYIDLQMLRFGNTIRIVRRIEAESMLDKQIEPMLLIPFIENAFKHGAVLVDQPEIRIALTADADALLLEVENKFKSGSSEIKDKNSGIGLVNVKRRLELLYPGRHELLMENRDDWYKIILKINLAG